jgi:ABC-type lipoprotein release transport system permease subunit
VVVPVTFKGIVQVMPLYGMESFIDIDAMREYFELGPEDLTEVMIRVDSLDAVPAVKAEIQGYLAGRGLDYAVLDYVEMGAGFMPTAVGFKIGLGVLIGLFVFAIVIFVVNMIMLAIIKRRREIGTAITLGMDRWEYVVVFLGEVFVIVTVSWIAGSILGGALVLLLSAVGMPGVMFFIDGLLYFDFSWTHLLLAYAVVLPAALVAALIPLLSIFRLRPVEVLREA